MPDIEVKVYWKGHIIKTVMRPKRVIEGVVAVVYKKKIYALKSGGRIDVDETPLDEGTRVPVQDILPTSILKNPQKGTSVAIERPEGLAMKTVNELALELYGVTVEGGPARFRTPGWFSAGVIACACPECGSSLFGFRKPYTSQAKQHHYWALVCANCKVALEPSQIKGEQRKYLYKTTEHMLSDSENPLSDKRERIPDKEIMPASIVAPTRQEMQIEWDVEQRAVIDVPPASRVLVSAGPGMGKTAIACARVAKLVANGVEPANIWLISFTRTAVREIRNRIAALVIKEDRASAVRITTLDSHAWHLAQGFDSESDREIFRGYDQTIESVLELLENGNEALDEYLGSLEHLIVDEAQDLVGLRSDLVYALIKKLPISCGVTVFADDAQAIYGWSADDVNVAGKCDLGDTLSKRLRVSKDVQFRTMELRTVHRTDSKSLKNIFEFTRTKVLLPGANAAKKVLEIRADIERFADAKVGQVLKQGIAGRDDILLLFRRRGEVLLASSFLLGGGIAHRIRMSGAPVCIVPWVGITLRDFCDRYLSRDQFVERWSERMHSSGDDPVVLESAWLELQRAAGERGGRVEMRRLRAKLGTVSPPLGFCNPELGTNGPIVGTIHASKGREADIVHLMLPRDAEDRATDEEGRVIFVGATRAKYRLHVGEGYQFAGSSLDGSGRAYRNSRKGAGTWASVEIGRAGDLDELSCVTSDNPSGTSLHREAQAILARYDGSVSPAKAICLSNGDGTYRWRLSMQHNDTDVYLCVLGNALIRDLFDVGREVRTWQSWSSKLKPLSSIKNFYVIGVRSIVLAPDHPHVETLEEPYSQSGIFLCPIVYGFPNVSFQSY